MRNVARLALVALVAVMCVGALAAPGASAAESLFFTESGKALLFTADSIGAATLRGKNAGVEGTIKCEKSSGHGFALDESSLAREVHLEFSGKCEQEISGSKGTCTEPIKPVLSYGELGLLNGHILLLVAPESGTEFVEVKCTNGNTKVSGAVIGEFPLNGRGGSLQYNDAVKDLLLLFKASGVKQEPEEIELLGSLMKGVSLKVEGFFGEKASEEASALILSDGAVQIQGPQPPATNATVSLKESGNAGGPSRTRTCPLNRARTRVLFRALNEWCEYEIRSTGEEITTNALEINLPEIRARGECERRLCLRVVRSENAPQCEAGRKVAANGACFYKLEYVFRLREEIVFYVITTSRVLIGTRALQEVE